MLPQIPTDNLYKFIAIFGLVLFVVPGLHSYNEWYEMLKEGVEVERKIIAAVDQLTLIIEQDSLMSQAYLHITDELNSEELDSVKLNELMNRQSLFFNEVYDLSLKQIQQKNELKSLFSEKDKW